MLQFWVEFSQTAPRIARSRCRQSAPCPIGGAAVVLFAASFDGKKRIRFRILLLLSGTSAPALSEAAYCGSWLSGDHARGGGGQRTGVNTIFDPRGSPSPDGISTGPVYGNNNYNFFFYCFNYLLAVAFRSRTITIEG